MDYQAREVTNQIIDRLLNVGRAESLVLDLIKYTLEEREELKPENIQLIQDKLYDVLELIRRDY